MSRYWLPAIDPDASLGGKPEMGRFVETNNESIDKISNNMICHNKEPKDLRSIPNVWARAMAYQMFFKEMMINQAEASDYCRRIIGEWRGLIAAIVLRKHYSLDIKADEITINENSSPYAEAAMSLLPPYTAYSGDSWNKISLLSCRVRVDNQMVKYPIGLTSPTTIVCAAAAHRAELPIGWHRDGYFVDPLTIENPEDKLTNADKIVLAYWLKEAIKRLGQAPRQDRDIAAALERSLRTYRDDLYMQYPAGYPTPEDEDQRPLVSFEPSGAVNRENRMLSLLFMEYTMNDTRSDLEFSADGIRHIIDPLSSDANPTVFGIYDYSMLKRNRALVERAIQDKRPGMRLYKMEDLFLPSLAFMVSSEKVHEHLRKRGFVSETPYVYSSFKQNVTSIEAIDDMVTPARVREARTESRVYILPLTELAFDLVPDLKNYVTVRCIDSDVVITIEVALLNGSTITLKKTYREAEQEKITDLPTAAIWPRYRMQGWNCYYLMSTQNQSRQYHFEPLSSGKSVAYKKLNEKGQDNKPDYARYYKCDKFPEFLRLIKNDRHYGYLVTAEPESRGTGGNFDTIMIGVDFGTSSTTLYYTAVNQEGDPEHPEKLDFEDTLAVICCDQQWINRLIEFFIPPFGISTPFPTVAHVMKESGAQEPYLDANVFFHKTLPNPNDIYAGRDDAAAIGKLKSQIKWADNPSTQLLSKTVIAQAVMQAILWARLKGYSRIKWKFSYPLALSKPKEFSVMCMRCVEDFSRACGLETDARNSVDMMTESEAVARYFIHDEHFQCMDRNITIIDIGGGSSDIFILQQYDGSSRCLQTSIRYGARNMLIDLLAANRSFFIDLIQEVRKRHEGVFKDYLGNPLTDKKEIEKIEKEVFYMFVENLLSTDVMVNGSSSGKTLGNLFSDLIIEYSLDADDGIGVRIKQFRTIMAFYISSLFYYCGMLIRYTRHGNASQARSPFIGIAGNGSKILDWIKTGFFNDEAVSDYLKAFMNEGILTMGPGAVYEAERTRHPKEEAAKGLVSKPVTYSGRKLDSDGIEKVVLAGEPFAVALESGTREIDPMTNLMALPEEYINKQWKCSSLVEVERFLALFNRLAATNGLNFIEMSGNPRMVQTPSTITIPRDELTGALNRKLSSSLQASLDDTRGAVMNESSRTRESLFIMAIMTVIDEILLKKWKAGR